MTDTVDILNDMARELAAITDGLRRDVESHKSDDHVELIRFFDRFSKAYDTFGDAKKALTEMYEAMSRNYVPDAMRAAGVKTTTVVGVGRVTISHRFSCSMLDKEAGIDWLKNHGLEGIVQETVNSSTLSATAKRMIENEGKELPDNLFKIGISPYTSITRS